MLRKGSQRPNYDSYQPRLPTIVNQCNHVGFEGLLWGVVTMAMHTSTGMDLRGLGRGKDVGTSISEERSEFQLLGSLVGHSRNDRWIPSGCILYRWNTCEQL